MANLYQIRQEIENFEYEIDEETGELLNALAWDDLNMSFEEKIENIACCIKNLASDVLAFKAEEEQLEKRRKSKEKKMEYLKKMLADNMNGQKFSTARCAVSFRKSTKLEVLNAEILPKALMVETIKTVPDANAIKALLKNGMEVPGCRLVENLNTQVK